MGPASVTFTNGNWSTPLTVTLTGVDDAIDDGDVAYSIVTAPAASADPVYNGSDASDVAATNTDDDGAGIAVTPIAGLTTTEAGGPATFTIVLDSQARPTSPSGSRAEPDPRASSPPASSRSRADLASRNRHRDCLDAAFDDATCRSAVTATAVSGETRSTTHRSATSRDPTPTTTVRAQVAASAGSRRPRRGPCDLHDRAHEEGPTPTSSTSSAIGSHPLAPTVTFTTSLATRSDHRHRRDDALDDGDFGLTIVTLPHERRPSPARARRATSRDNIDDDAAGFAVTPTPPHDDRGSAAQAPSFCRSRSRRRDVTIVFSISTYGGAVGRQRDLHHGQLVDPPHTSRSSTTPHGRDIAYSS